VGDAENDRDFLRICDLSATVANALPELKRPGASGYEGTAGAGVVDLIESSK